MKKTKFLGTVIVIITVFAIACEIPLANEAGNTPDAVWEDTATVIINAPGASVLRSAMDSNLTLQEKIALIAFYQITITDAKGDIKYRKTVAKQAFPLEISKLTVGETTFEVIALDSNSEIKAQGSTTKTLVPGTNFVSIILTWEPEEAEITLEITFEDPIPINEGKVWIDIKEGLKNIEFPSLDVALDYIQENAVNNGNYTVRIGEDMNICNRQLFYDDKTVHITWISNDGAEKRIRIGVWGGTLIEIGKGVTLTLDKGITLLDPTSSYYHECTVISVKEKFIMKGGSIIKENNAGSGWYAVSVETTGTFIMDSGTIYGNDRSSSGILVSGNFIMNGGKISGCSESLNDWGAGVWVGSGACFTMNDGLITGNSAYKGAGVYVFYDGTFAMNGGTISENTAAGVYVEGNANLTMTGGIITNNRGGVWIHGSTSVFIMTGGTISKNTGMGVYVLYSNLKKTGGTVSDNTDYAIYAKSYVDLIADLIAYIHTAPPEVQLTFTNAGLPFATGDWDYCTTYIVSFNPNGGNWAGDTANKAISPYLNNPVIPPIDPVYDGRNFVGWYTHPTSGTAFDLMSSITSDITLYAKWTPITYTITYDKNANNAIGNTATSSHTYDFERALAANAYTRIGYTFAGWDTKADGTGNSYTDSQNVKNLTIVDGDVIILYAKWEPLVPVDMVWVPGGSFQMGSNAADARDNEKPMHTVMISSFFMGKYEVTQKQYKAIMGSNPSRFTGDDNRPVEMVTFFDALEFCNRLSEIEGLTPVYTISGKTMSGNSIGNATVTADWYKNGYRLPTEAEWEYSAKGGNGSPENYIYSGSNDLYSVAWYGANSSDTTHPVGTKAANGLGIYDMTGNVWEMCWDIYGPYSGNAQTDPLGASSGSSRVARGGAYNTTLDNSLRLLTRNYGNPVNSVSFAWGIRLVRR